MINFVSWSKRVLTLKPTTQTLHFQTRKKQALIDLSDRFCWSLVCYSEFTRKVSQACFSKKEYEDAIAIMHKHDIVTPPLEPMPHLEPSHAIFRHLANDSDVPRHKIQIIAGILACPAGLSAVSGALYEQREDEPRMQLILTILETKN